MLPTAALNINSVSSLKRVPETLYQVANAIKNDLETVVTRCFNSEITLLNTFPGNSTHNSQLEPAVHLKPRSQDKSQIYLTFEQILDNYKIIPCFTPEIRQLLNMFSNKNHLLPTLVSLYIMYLFSIRNPHYRLKIKSLTSFSLTNGYDSYLLYCLIGDNSVCKIGKINFTSHHIQERMNGYKTALRTFHTTHEGNIRVSNFRLAYISSPIPKDDDYESKIRSFVDDEYNNGTSRKVLLSNRHASTEYRTAKNKKDTTLFTSLFKQFLDNKGIQCHELKLNLLDQTEVDPEAPIYVTDFESTKLSSSMYIYLANYN